MIRRDQNTPGVAERWVLFQQPHHAELSAQLASIGHSPNVLAIEPHREILNAIAMHDDGWSQWEKRPQVHHGRPIAFDEMPLSKSLPIWRESISLGLSSPRPEAFSIAGHFARLLREHDSWNEVAEQRHLAEQFLDWTDLQMAQWQAQWQALAPGNSAADCIRGTEFVRLYDAFSLWLLCAERTQPTPLRRLTAHILL